MTYKGIPLEKNQYLTLRNIWHYLAEYRIFNGFN
jgi:hypothetical protein